ncbi:MAG: rhodanese-like domain-containing protein [Flavobacterium sp.]|nr:rhodanese-like domain-containing protein [Flavobacterium sp.]
MKKLLLIIITGLLSAICNAQNYESLLAKKFQEKLNTEKSPQILDVRSPEEFISGHIENAININWNSSDFSDKVKSFVKTKPIFVNCLGGGRSKKASEALSLLGFTKVYELKGGISEWKSNNFPIKI